MTLDLSWAHPLPLVVVALLALGALAAAVRGVVRAGRGGGPLLVRAVALCGLAVILLGPVSPEPLDPVRLRPTIALLVDRSRSMCTPDARFGDTACTRADALRAAWLDPVTLGALQKEADVQLFAFDEALERVSLARIRAEEATGASTRLARALAKTLESQRESRTLSDIVLLTDGADTGDPTGGALGPLADGALAAGVRVHAVVPGGDARPPDVAVRIAADAPVIQEGQSTTLRAKLFQRGFDGRASTLTIRQRDPGGADQVLLRRLIAVDTPDEVIAAVTPRPSVGAGDAPAAVEFIASIDPLDGEADRANNTQSVVVQVSRRPIRVALFENEPYWDSKFFVSALRTDPQVQLTVVMGLGPERQRVVRIDQAGAGAVEHSLDGPPLTEREVFDFDVIALGRGVERWFGGSRSDLLPRFVAERGGSLIFLRGPAVTGQSADADALRAALAPLAPVEFGSGVLAGARLVRTDAGWREPMLDFSDAEGAGALSELPGMIASTAIDREKSLSVVWLRQRDGAGDPAALAHMSYGRGRTLAVLADGLWRWAFLPASMGGGSSVYRVLWGRAVRWLGLGGEFLPGQAISVAVSAPATAPGRAVTIAVRSRYFADDPGEVSIRVRGPDGREQRLACERADRTSNRTLAVFTPEQEGVYEVEASSGDQRARTSLVAREETTELLDTAARPGPLRALAERTGGALLPIDRPQALLDLLAARRAETIASRAVAPAWDRAWVFGAILGLLGLEWFWRRWKGLP